MSTDVLVVGASGVVGRRVCAELDAGGVAFDIAHDKHDIDAKIVVNCAGALAGDSVIEVALAAGAHYLDVGGDQAHVHDLMERFDSPARRAGRTVLPACAVDCVLGDLAAAWAAQHVCGIHEDGDAVRTEPAPRIAEDRPFDEIAVSYIFDDLVLSAGSQRTLFGALGSRGLRWTRDRWETVSPGAEKRRVNAGRDFGGERDCVSFPGGDVLTVPRHVAAQRVQTFVSTTRSVAAATAMRWLSRASVLVPKRAGDLLAPYAPPDEEFTRTSFAIVAQVRRGFSAAQVVVRGTDLYQTSAAIIAWACRALVTRDVGPIGIRAPAELFRPEMALAELATVAGLDIEPSFR